MAKKGLVRQMGILLCVYALVTVIASGIVTFINQTYSYHADCLEDLQQITSHVTSLMQKEEPSFKLLKEWFDENMDKLRIPMDFASDIPRSKAAFYDYMAGHYDGAVLSEDISFEELDEEAKLLYLTWRMEYWFSVLVDARDEFGLSYVYFIYETEGEDLTMTYMFDGEFMPVVADDGTEYLHLGDKVYENPEVHRYMWETWESGMALDKVDSVNNEYGYMYTYCQPLIIDGSQVGMFCADMSVDRITSEIRNSVLRQVLVSTLLVILTTVALFGFLNKRIIMRVLRLENYVNKYSENKDPALAEDIVRSSGASDEIGALGMSFAEMISSLDNYMINLQKVTAEKERIGAELSVATQIQADMLPRIFPPFPSRNEFEIFASMDPAKEVGGDFYDFFLVDDTHMALVCADVSGKGVPAALFMAISKALIKNHAQMGEAPGQALMNVNEQLCEGNEAGLFVTVWLAVIDLETGHVLEANAGHEHPVIRKKDGSFEFHRTRHSPAVATMEGMRFRQTEFDLEEGDELFIYTDGVTEATNLENQLFGEARLLDALNENKDLRPEELLPRVRHSIDTFVGKAPQFDDITMLAFLFHGRKQD